MDDRKQEMYLDAHVALEELAERMKPAEDTLALYIIDMDKKASKRFTVTKTVLYLLARKTARIMYGTSNEKDEQFKVILQWEKEKRVTR